MKQLKLNVTAREGKGRSASRRLRSAGKIPAILYGKHTEPVQLAVEEPEFRRLLKSVGGSATIFEFRRPDGRDALSFIQEVQKDPLTDEYLHVDFHEVAPNEKMEINVGVRITGESNGVKNEGGILDVSTYSLRIRCLPKDLPEFVDIDVTSLNVGDSIHVSELKVIAGVDFLDNPKQPVVACVAPAEEEAAAAAPGAPAAAAAEGAAAPAAGAAAPAAAPAAGAKAAAPAAAKAPAAAAAKAPAKK
jgi:large subunit ribosomal protein L25